MAYRVNYRLLFPFEGKSKIVSHFYTETQEEEDSLSTFHSLTQSVYEVEYYYIECQNTAETDRHNHKAWAQCEP